MSFDQITGHNEIKERLINSIKCDKVSHAYIFVGKRGVGKMTTAVAYANMLTNGCESDITIVTNEFYGVESKSDAISVNTVRAASADMYKKPYMADKRVFIIPNAEKMNASAQNALLKIFEEPPHYCVIILVTQNDSMLLPTVRSRAVTVRFASLDDNDVKKYLCNNSINYSDIIIRLASGSIGMALDMCKNEELEGVTDGFVSLFGNIGLRTAYNTYQIISYLQKEKKYYEVLFDIMLIMLSDTLLKKDGGLIIEGLNQRIIVKIIEVVENTRNSFSYNANYDMAVNEMMLNILGAVND